jgi:transposase-like protein
MKEAITFPELFASTDQRPAACPRCGRAGMGWHRAQRRPVVDLKLREVQVVQYQCGGCGASVTVTPPGLRPGCKHSERTKVLSVVLWGLGLSFRDAASIMKGLGVPISHVEIILNVRAMGAEAMKRQQQAVGKIKTSVLGADETEVKLSGHGVTLGFLTDPSTGEIVGMEILTSREGEELGRWIVEAAQHFGAKALVSDELESYQPAAEKAGLEHQLCLAHWRKAVARRLKKIEGYPEEKKLIREALKQLDDKGLAAIRWLHQQFRRARPPRKGERQSPEYSMRMLTLDIIENWNRLVCYQQEHEALRDELGRKVPRTYTVPSTNNATENAIGRGGKIRAKRMRGFKRADTILPIMFLLASLSGVLAGVPFRTLIF